MFKNIFSILFLFFSFKSMAQYDTLKINEMKNIRLNQVLKETSTLLKKHRNTKGYLAHLKNKLNEDQYKQLSELLTNQININEVFPDCIQEDLILRCGLDVFEFISESEIKINNSFVLNLEEARKHDLLFLLNEIYSKSYSGKFNIFNMLFVDNAYATDAESVLLGVGGTLGVMQAWSWIKRSNGKEAASKITDLKQLKAQFNSLKGIPRSEKAAALKAIGEAEKAREARVKAKAKAKAEPKAEKKTPKKKTPSKSPKNPKSAGKILSRGGVAGVAATTLGRLTIAGVVIGTLVEGYNAIWRPANVFCENGDYKVCRDNRLLTGVVMRFATNNCFNLDLSEKYLEETKISKLVSDMGPVASEQLKAATSEEECDDDIAQIFENELNESNNSRDIINEAIDKFSKRENRFAPTEITRPTRAVDDRRVETVTTDDLSSRRVDGSVVESVTEVKSSLKDRRVIQSEGSITILDIYKANHNKKNTRKQKVNFSKKFIGI